MLQDQNHSLSWRLIDSGPMTARENMAVDEALARHALDAEARAVLRLYCWKPPAISLGFHQSVEDVDVDRCRRDGIDIVVRPTGGRAVLHADELTYAVIIPRHNPIYHDNILVVYERISASLLKAFHLLGIEAEFERADRTPRDFSRGELSSLCYASSVQYEIGHQGRKMVGSAQRRLNGVVLQHGSILVGPRHLDLPLYLRRGDDRWRQGVRSYMQRHTITLNELSRDPVSYARLANAMAELGVSFVSDSLTSREEQTVAERIQPPLDAVSREEEA